MQPTIQWTLLFPVLLQLLQTIAVLFLTTALLRRRKLLSAPLGAVDTGSIIFCATMILGALILSAGSTEYLFRAYKMALASNAVFAAAFGAFSRYFMVLLCVWFLYLSLSIITLEVFSGNRSRDELSTGNIPLAVLCSAVSLGLAWVLGAVATSIYEWLTPVFLNFR